MSSLADRGRCGDVLFRCSQCRRDGDVLGPSVCQSTERRVPAFPGSGRAAAGIRYFKVSPWYLSSTLCIMVFLRADQYAVASLRGEFELGLYAAAITISQISYVLADIIMLTSAPKLTRAFHIDPANFRATLLKSMGAMGLLAVPIAPGFSALSELILPAAYGPAYSSAAAVLGVHAFVAIPVYVGYVQQYWYTVNGKMRLHAFNMFLGATLVVGLSYGLVSMFGAVGGAWAVLIAQCAVAFVLNMLPLLRIPESEYVGASAKRR
ncbi:MAG: oligosaccharide flippase family protein [Rhodospirillales bacterium]|nr:oligosaccharide flippase family protein [Rhodospirillales bacterium]